MNNVSCSNNTNKLSPQEPRNFIQDEAKVQIIQINLALKNQWFDCGNACQVQIIQINLALKNKCMDD